ncbi:MAG: NHLP bacteriocin export ABC transporter permease/ATPase subunit [Eubacterium sp.]|nr:NHLP bacteriocin export ABC transporter permease/ATPase subunit [Eubacterium sp.]
MGWFDDQIKDRIKNDNDVFSDAFHDMSGVIMGKKAFLESFDDSQKQVLHAVYDILKFYHIKPQEIPLDIKDIEDQIDFFLRPNGIMKREVTLSGKWYRDGIGPLLATTTDGRIIALIPCKISGYKYFDYDSGKYVKINKRNYTKISPEAVCFYKPFPLRKLTSSDLFKYFLSTVSGADWIMIIVATLAASLVGTVVTYANSVIFGKVLDLGEMTVFIAAFVMLIGVSLSQLMINVIKSLVTSRINTKMSVSVESAAMMRILSLPATFFKQFSSGDLANRLNQIKIVCSSISSILFTSGLTTLFSLIYFIQIFKYAPSLVVPAVIVIVVTVAIFIVVSLLLIKNFNRTLAAESKASGFVFSLLSGIEKIKLTGAEKRSFAKWAKLYKDAAGWKYNPPLAVKLINAIIIAVNTIGTIAIYYSAYASNVNLSEYMAFSVAYGMVSGTFMMLTSSSTELSQIKPSIELIRPIMETEPEIASDKNVITRMSGGIELSNIYFRYSENMPLVIDGLSLKISAGQYVAIVGSTGCGKSTLMRLMLGFETPQKGAVYYDGKDLSTIDLKSLRRNIGTVMQNGKLFSGDIYSNIVISAPQLSIDEAWEAAEMAGVAEDIRNMPMGMHTIISEGSGGISGGQRQRIMIARAIAAKPKILMFDEATSALDNITQKHVSDSLDNLRCTRIVIAHRLSTIQNCDRIIVLDKGKIVEDGKYDELIEKGGIFAELVDRQRLDK